MKVHRLAVGRVFLLAALLAPLPTPVPSQADSTTEGQRKGNVHRIIILQPDRVTLYEGWCQACNIDYLTSTSYLFGY